MQMRPAPADKDAAETVTLGRGREQPLFGSAPAFFFDYLAAAGQVIEEHLCALSARVT